jgi:hypothetical protein
VLTGWSDSANFRLFGRVARFFFTLYTKTREKIPNYHNITKWPLNIPNDHKIFQMTTKYTGIFHSKALQNLHKFGCLVWKQTIWQPCSCVIVLLGHFLKIKKVAHIAGPLFPRLRLCFDFGKKNWLGYILGDFSQTHLVTLSVHSSVSNDFWRRRNGTDLLITQITHPFDFRFTRGRFNESQLGP